MDQRSIEYLRSMDNKKIASLLRGIYNFFERRFSPENFGNIHQVNNLGYTLDYLGVEYDMNFFYKDNFKFIIKAKIQNSKEDLEEKLKEQIVSNIQLNKSKYLSKREIISNDSSVEIICTIKKYPNNEQETNELCKLLWGEIVQVFMKNIHTKSNTK